MTRREKLLDSMRENPNGVRFDDFETLLAQCDWTLVRRSGSPRNRLLSNCVSLRRWSRKVLEKRENLFRLPHVSFRLRRCNSN
jgi:hypothetical protein